MRKYIIVLAVLLVCLNGCNDNSSDVVLVPTNQNTSMPEIVSTIEPTPTITIEPTETPISPPEDTIFRNTTWGMSKDDVKALETSEFVEENETDLLYRGSLSSDDVAILYSFIDDKLVRGVYIVEENHIQSYMYISSYMSYSKSITEKYGIPVYDKEDRKSVV